MADAMDSKSISRKGVGVQVPASAPPPGDPRALRDPLAGAAPGSRALRDPLARAMLPVLLHRIGNASQLLSNLEALLEIRPAALDERSEDLAAAGEIVDDAGWLLALLASASGARLLLDRREAHGLGPLLACVRACLRREGRDLEASSGPLPALAPGVASGWEFPWYVASVLYLSGRELEPQCSLAWAIERAPAVWRVSCLRTTDARPDLEIAGIRDRVEGDRRVLEVPEAWLA